MKREIPKWAPYAILFAAVVLTYWPILQNGFIWDDDNYLLENALVRSWDGLSAIWLTTNTPQYYPVVFTVLWGFHKLFGLAPFPYHALSLVLQFGVSAALFALIRRFAPTLALGAALVFAIHPMQVETVAWVTEYKNLFSAFFLVLACHEYLSFIETTEPRRRYRAFAWLLAALLSKTTAVAFVAFPPLYFFWKNGRVTRRDLAPLAPFVLICAMAGTLTAYLEVHHVGARGNDWSIGTLEKPGLAARILLTYLVKFAAPIQQCFIYPKWNLSSGFWLGLLALAFSTGAFALLYLKHERLGRGSFALVAATAAAAFPALGFFNVYPMRFSYIADHFFYLGTIPAAILAAAVLRRIHRYAAFVPVLVYFAFQSHAYTRVFQGQQTLWTDVIAKNPSTWIAYNCLGNQKLAAGEFDEAERLIRRAIELNPSDSGSLANLGALLLLKQDKVGALQALREALSLNPGDTDANINLGVIFAGAGDFESAARHFEQAIGGMFNQFQAHFNLARALEKLGRGNEAAIHFDAARKIDPDLYRVNGGR